MKKTILLLVFALFGAAYGATDYVQVTGSVATLYIDAIVLGGENVATDKLDTAVYTTGALASCNLFSTGKLDKAVYTTGAVQLTTTDYTDAVAKADIVYTGAVYLTTTDYTDAVAKADISYTGKVDKTAIWGVPGATMATSALVCTATVNAKDANGNNLAEYRILHFWTSESSMGAASTNNIESISLSNGTAVATVTADADYWYLTSSGGSATCAVVATAVATNYLMISDGASVNSFEMIFTE